MNFDLYTVGILILGVLILMVACIPIVSGLFSRRNGKDAKLKTISISDNTEDEPFPMVSAVNEKEEYYNPKEEELEHVQECVCSNEESYSLDADKESDYSVLFLTNIPKQKLHNAMINLMKSRMQFTDAEGKPITMEKLLSDFGIYEEVVKDNDTKQRPIDPEPNGQRQARIDQAIKKLGKKKK